MLKGDFTTNFAGLFHPHLMVAGQSSAEPNFGVDPFFGGYYGFEQLVVPPLELKHQNQLASRALTNKLQKGL